VALDWLQQQSTNYTEQMAGLPFVQCALVSAKVLLLLLKTHGYKDNGYANK
jgi:hypothetical protein